MAIELLQKNNIITVIISKENSAIFKQRSDKLKIKEIYVVVKEKINIIEKLKEKYKAEYENIAYMGDDINYLPVLKKVSLSFASKDTIEQVKQIVDYVISKKGGKGVLRSAVDIILAKIKKVNYDYRDNTRYIIATKTLDTKRIDKISF